ncbi:unnamed protein product [Thelazia callipaeda]|uniref:Beta-1,3-galactosyl-O-glycosyl-glycoprotein beta-1,6-N-acetylglucosaminyltransferase 4 n=1 Tax=Thelazia callipaeda TaxID=103827 RepID=A0A0N5CYD6_THECL|nr:unnamed protein product [Thelazia callipaeda]
MLTVNKIIKRNTLFCRCNFLKTHYGFLEKASSDEELHYSLAYGILVHQNIDQVFYMLSAIYQPQNVYCIAVDGKATQTFWTSINYLKSCLPNITIIKVPVVKWCTYSVLHGVHTCLKNLSKSPYEWQYYQYLSNIDLPLRTNREMVRIFKKLNGSINAEVLKFQPFRLLGSKRPVPYNSSLSATFSRKSANFFANSDEANAILRFLKSTYCPDESFWLTVAGNPKILDVAMPGNFDGMKFLTMINNVAKQRRNSFYKDRSQKVYYISRYQLWLHGRRKCHGKWKRASCVFGVQDIRNLINQPHLVAHKFLLSVQPAAFFCIYKLVRERSLRDISDFNDGPYGNLPGPRITRGESVRNWFYDFHDNKSWYRY